MTSDSDAISATASSNNRSKSGTDTKDENANSNFVWHNRSATSDDLIEINDGLTTYTLTIDDTPFDHCLRELAESFVSTYSYAEGSAEVVAIIRDLHDEEEHRFAFAPNGQFEWDTEKEHATE